MPVEDSSHDLFVGGRLDSGAISRAWAHAVKQQRLVEHLATESQARRLQPEIQVFIGLQPGIESAHSIPQRSTKHTRHMYRSARQHTEWSRRRGFPGVACAF